MQRLMHQWPDHDSRDGRFSRSQPAVIFLIIAGAIFMVAIFDSRIEARADPITIDDKITLPRSTNSFYGLCKYNADWCEGYLTGIGDILLAMGNSHILGGICNAEYDSAMLAESSNSGWKTIPKSDRTTSLLVPRLPFAKCGRARNGGCKC